MEAGMRKLASIQRIWNIEPIEGADRIELAHVLGWQCVVDKGQFKPMDLAVYFEVDSFLPVRPEFEFLSAGKYRRGCFCQQMIFQNLLKLLRSEPMLRNPWALKNGRLKRESVPEVL